MLYGYGKVTRAGEDFDEAKDAAREQARRHGWRFAEDGAVAAISEGAASIAVEMLMPDGQARLDAVLVAVGNGSLINGVGAWFKHRSPGTQVIGICAARADAMEKSWRTGAAVTAARVDTIADGLAVRVPVPEAVDDMRRFVDEMLLVDEDGIRRAMARIQQHTGLAVEPSAAVGLAALMEYGERFREMAVATVLCGAGGM